MSRYVGDVRQIAVIVDDAYAAAKHWVDTLGVGPFFVVHGHTFKDYKYLGRPAPSPVLTIAMAYTGNLQIEIIQQHNDAPSGYVDFMRAKGSGMQHVAAFYEKREDFLASYRRLQEAGLECAHEGTGSTGVLFAYFRAPGDPAGIQMEIAEALAPPTIGFQKMMHAASIGWDGRDPIREVGGFSQN